MKLKINAISHIFKNNEYKIKTEANKRFRTAETPAVIMSHTLSVLCITFIKYSYFGQYQKCELFSYLIFIDNT